MNQAMRLLQDSLARRMRTMTSLYNETVDTMTLEQVNHVDAEGRLPIAFSLFHYVNMHDGGRPMGSATPRSSGAKRSRGIELVRCSA